MTTPSCPICEAPATSIQVTEGSPTATCRICFSTFDLLGGGHEHREPVALPPGMAARVSEDRLEIDRRWFHWQWLLYLPLAAGWLALFLNAYPGALRGEFDWTHPADVVFALIFYPLPILLMSYLGIANLLNRTRIVVAGRELRLGHTPLPWWPIRRLPVASLDQLYVRRVRRPNGRGSYPVYQLWVQTRPGKELLLVNGLLEPEQAFWMEEVLEQHLGITDRPVSGAFTRAELQP